MAHKTIAKIIAIPFFIFWLIVLWMGADHPVPPGFIIVALIDLAAAFVVYWRIPTYLQWHIDEKPLRLLRVLADGLAAGVVIAIFMMLLPGTGDPSAPDPTLIDHLIWVMVLGFMGMFNSTLVYGIVTVIERLTNRKSTGNKK